MADILPRRPLNDDDRRNLDLARSNMLLRGFNHVVSCDSRFITSLGNAALEGLASRFNGEVRVHPDPDLARAEKYMVVGFRDKDDAALFEGTLQRLIAAVPL